MTNAARGITLVAAQTEADAQRVRSLGVQRVEITGSIKFDVVVPDAILATGAALRAAIGERPVLLCASTREGEEEPILQAYVSARSALPPDVLLLVVPRHPQRFDEVAQMIAARGLTVERRSHLALDGGAMPHSVDVLLGDSMGEMFAYYAACDVAFVGGSLQPLGGQNMIEPAALGKPVLIGQHTFNFAVAAERHRRPHPDGPERPSLRQPAPRRHPPHAGPAAVADRRAALAAADSFGNHARAAAVGAGRAGVAIILIKQAAGALANRANIFASAGRAGWCLVARVGRLRKSRGHDGLNRVICQSILARHSADWPRVTFRKCSASRVPWKMRLHR
ncbi:3-deoxy-d-manno-octulosonic-acid transferase, putative [Ricinus communis]|uniref:3-deoxy-d-manno-octulosonic-acid transferase, putative n=1 Tax=Ricinus communis TaxID=3988 RepID=B9TGU5_RICCO|nr:3-deoxy-d-manno-octulosonic-acid transferase, putative [Ricinus communis]